MKRLSGKRVAGLLRMPRACALATTGTVHHSRWGRCEQSQRKTITCWLIKWANQVVITTSKHRQNVLFVKHQPNPGTFQTSLDKRRPKSDIACNRKPSYRMAYPCLVVALFNSCNIYAQIILKLHKIGDGRRHTARAFGP